jgi:energy-coupling factor transporter ATP-binding protein EcfA2
MKIEKYEYQDFSKPGWTFNEVEFGRINLLVGNSGMGKTRLLNTIFNLGTFISQKQQISSGTWNLTLLINNYKYIWELQSVEKKDNSKEIVFEKLVRLSSEDEVLLIDRNEKGFNYKGDPLPKLQKDVSGICLLADEEDIKPLIDGFSKILRRKFFEADLSNRCAVGVINNEMLKRLDEVTDIQQLYPNIFNPEFTINSVMYILKTKFPSIYDKICDYFKNTFSFIEKVNVLELQQLNISTITTQANIPVFCIKEKGVDKWIPLHELSSGMQKTLLILTDVFTLPSGSIYLIDEYENSLGMNSINCFPDLILKEDVDIQFIITSHHPYIINKFPIKNWYVLHRIGSDVHILYGKDVVERYGISKQQAYIKLLNDSFFIEGKI